MAENSKSRIVITVPSAASALSVSKARMVQERLDAELRFTPQQRGQSPPLVPVMTVALHTTIGEKAFFIERLIDLRDANLDTRAGTVMLALATRQRLVEGLLHTLENEIHEDIIPPSGIQETGVFCRGTQLLFESTGSRGKDELVRRGLGRVVSRQDGVYSGL